MVAGSSIDNQVWRVSLIGRGGAIGVALIWLVVVVAISTGKSTSAGVRALLWITLLVVAVGDLALGLSPLRGVDDPSGRHSEPHHQEHRAV